jgi:hypothetical protein
VLGARYIVIEFIIDDPTLVTGVPEPLSKTNPVEKYSTVYNPAVKLADVVNKKFKLPCAVTDEPLYDFVIDSGANGVDASKPELVLINTIDWEPPAAEDVADADPICILSVVIVPAVNTDALNVPICAVLIDAFAICAEPIAALAMNVVILPEFICP